MTAFSIDFFELAFLAEVCVPPVPIARAHFWDKLCDVHYHKMSEEERERLLEWLFPRLDLSNMDCQHFVCRFSRHNQYILTVNYLGTVEKRECYLYNGEYHTYKNTTLNPSFIKETKKKY